jgi:hypothetical protein
VEKLKDGLNFDLPRSFALSETGSLIQLLENGDQTVNRTIEHRIGCRLGAARPEPEPSSIAIHQRNATKIA